MSLWTEKDSVASSFWQNGRTPFPVYDMHGHMGSHGAILLPGCEAPDMIRHLRNANVARLVFSHHHTLWNPKEMPNERVFEICRDNPDILRMYAGINPHFPDMIHKDIELFESWGKFALGFKMLCAYHHVCADDKRYRPVYEFADEKSLILLFHTWASDLYASVDTMIKLACEYPNATFFMGHAFRSDFEGVSKVASETPGNVYFELTSIPGCAGLVEKLVETVTSKRLIFGTDLPWFDEFQHIGGVISSDINDEAKYDILSGNVERLLGNNW